MPALAVADAKRTEINAAHLKTFDIVSPSLLQFIHR
jgi:hypothetical protein